MPATIGRMVKKIQYWPVTFALLMTTTASLVSLAVAQVEHNEQARVVAFGVLIALQPLMAVVLPRFTTAWKKVKDLAPGAVELLEGKVQP